jgi:hypothetical protein
MMMKCKTILIGGQSDFDGDQKQEIGLCQYLYGEDEFYSQ